MNPGASMPLRSPFSAADRPGSADRVVVIGAGLSGLSAAHRLVSRASTLRKPIEVVVLDSRDRPGGAIWTERRDGFLIEGGADSFITNKPAALNLCRELGLGETLIGTDDRNRRSFVVRDGRLLTVPDGFVLMSPSKLTPILTSPILSWRGKLRVLMDLFLPRGSDDGDESLASFARRRFGREALDRLIQPLVGGIYTADPRDLSLRATLPQFLAMEREHGSLIRASIRNRRASRADSGASGARYGLFVAPKDGMSTITEALAASLPAGSLRLNTSVRRLSRPDPLGSWLIEPLDGPAIEASAVLLTTEAHATARLVEGLDGDLPGLLRSIPYASSAIVNIAYRRDAIAHPLNGFGAVVPTIEGRSILAVSFTSVKFPGRAPDGTVLFRVFVGGATQPELFELDDAAIAAIARQEMSELLGASGEPLFAEDSRHPRAMPQYTLGHLDRVASIRSAIARHPGLALAGNAFDGVGIPDCVRAAREAADSVIAGLAGESHRAVA